MSKGCVRVLAVALLFAGEAAGHAPVIYEGVHFTAELMDFSAPPPRYMHYFGSSTRPGTRVLPDDRPDDSMEEEARLKKIEGTFKKALAAERAGRYTTALSLFRTLQTSAVGPLLDPERAFGLLLPDRDFLQQRVEVLAHPRERGLAQFLEVTRPGRKETKVGRAAAYSPRLLSYLQYRAAMNTLRDDLAATRFEVLAKHAPDSPRAEAALIMVPRLLLAESPPLPSGAELLMRCRRSDAAVRRLLALNPDTRFRFDAYGALGRIEFVLGRVERALDYYRTQLLFANTNDQRVQAWSSVAACEIERGRLKGTGSANLENIALAHLLRFEAVEGGAKSVAAGQLREVVKRFDSNTVVPLVRLLRSDARALPAYIDWRLDLTPTKPEQRANLVALSQVWLTAHPKSPQAGRVLARTAEIELDLGMPSRALALARRALDRSGIADADAALARFVQASAARRAGKVVESIGAYEGLVKRHPKSYLVGAARENLALLYERQGRLGKALDQYYALDYMYDVAYLVDVRMSPAQLSAYVAAHPKHPRAKELRFALGLRYLRLGEWNRAESLFLSLRKPDREEMAGTKGVEPNVWYDDPASLRDPLATTRELRGLDRAFQSARGKEAKAKALLGLAKGYYERRNLALYNYRLWQGERANAFGFSWNHVVATKADTQALLRHHFEHECLAHTLTLCERLVSKFPNSGVTAEAAYLGANSARRLGSLNQWWRAEGRTDALFARAKRLFTVIVERFPTHAHARHAAEKINQMRQEQIEHAAFELQYKPDKAARGWPGF